MKWAEKTTIPADNLLYIKDNRVLQALKDIDYKQPVIMQDASHDQNALREAMAANTYIKRLISLSAQSENTIIREARKYNIADIGWALQTLEKQDASIKDAVDIVRSHLGIENNVYRPSHTAKEQMREITLPRIGREFG